MRMDTRAKAFASILIVTWNRLLTHIERVGECFKFVKICRKILPVTSVILLTHRKVNKCVFFQKN